MNRGIKLILAILLATSLELSAHAAPGITVNWSAFDLTGISLAGGTVPVPAGNLIEVGTFIGPAPTVGTFTLTNFTVFATGLMGAGGGGDGFWSISSVGDGTPVSHDQIYIVAFNAATANAATEAGIWTIDDTVNTNWKFPDNADIINSTSIDIENLINNPGTSGATLNSGAQIIFGGNPLYVANDPNNFGANSTYLPLQTIPEPSTFLLVGFGLVGIWGLRRKRRS